MRDVWRSEKCEVLRAIVFVSLLSSLASCAHAPGPAVSTQRVLLVGDSLSYRNDPPAHLSAVAGHAFAHPIEVEMISGGGERIDRHAARRVVEADLRML